MSPDPGSLGAPHGGGCQLEPGRSLFLEAAAHVQRTPDLYRPSANSSKLLVKRARQTYVGRMQDGLRLPLAPWEVWWEAPWWGDLSHGRGSQLTARQELVQAKP